jgi:hypothetical protein
MCLLLRLGGRMRDSPHVKPTQVHGEQVMEHRGRPASVDLGIERGPVIMVFGSRVSVGDVENKPTTIAHANGGDPIVVGRNDYAQAIVDHYRIAELGFELKLWLGDEGF